MYCSLCTTVYSNACGVFQPCLHACTVHALSVCAKLKRAMVWALWVRDTLQTCSRAQCWQSNCDIPLEVEQKVEQQWFSTLTETGKKQNCLVDLKAYSMACSALYDLWHKQWHHNLRVQYMVQYMVHKLAQFELRDSSNGLCTDVFEIRHAFVEVKDSQGLRLVRSGSHRRHLARQPSLARWQCL